MQYKARILFAEDDINAGIIAKKRLGIMGYDVQHCPDGSAALELYYRGNRNFDLCLLDVTLPKISGYDLAREIRLKNDRIPIIFLSSLARDEDKFKGFQAGGDDFLPKPFNFAELDLRIQVFLKRSKMLVADEVGDIPLGGDHILKYADLTLVNEKSGQERMLSQKMADLLRYLIEHKNKILTREEVLYHVWGKNDYFMGRSMDVYLTKLRRIFKEINHVDIQTYHGKGLKFVVKSSR